MSLLDANQPEPSKTPRYIILGVMIVFLAVFLSWRAVRYDAEEKVATDFFSSLAAGDLQKAYTLWKPTADYSFKDFQDDWGPSGFYGPIKSFKIESAAAPRKSDTSVAVRVLVSPYTPFPKYDDTRETKTKSIVIWVNRANHSLSLPPPTY